MPRSRIRLPLPISLQVPTDKLALDLVSRIQSMEELVRTLTTHLRTLISADGCSLLLWEHNMLYDVQRDVWHGAAGIVGHTARTGEPMRLDPRDNSLYDSVVDEPATAYLCVPARLHDQTTVAVIRAVRRDPSAKQFTDKDQVVGVWGRWRA